MKRFFNPFLASLVVYLVFPPIGLCESLSCRDASVDELIPMVEAGDPEARFLLGSLYLNGAAGVSIDVACAAGLLRISAEQGHAAAQALWGHMLITAHGVPVDFESGLEWVRKSAAQDNPSAQFYLGTYYETGRAGLVPDRFEAMDWYMKAAGQGHVQADVHLERMRSDSDAVRNGTAGTAWWNIPEEELIQAAMCGDGEAQWKLGMRYEGHGQTAVDIRKAGYWYRQAVAHTNIAAFHSMALLHTTCGKILPERAYKYCLVSATYGNLDAMCTLARFYRDGIGVEVNRAESLHWYRQALSHGHPSAESEIHALIQGAACFEDTGVAADDKKKELIALSDYSPPSIVLTIQDGDNQRRNVRLIGYDAIGKLVETDYRFGETSTLPLAAFADDSRSIILNADLFNAFEELKVRFDHEKLSEKECEQEGVISGEKGPSDYEYDGYRYVLSFLNKRSIPLEDMRVECMLVCEIEEQRTQSDGDKTYAERTKQENCLIPSVTVGTGDVVRVETEPFILESYTTEAGLYFLNGGPTEVDSSPVGLAVRVSCRMNDGCLVYRDFYEKDVLASKVSW